MRKIHDIPFKGWPSVNGAIFALFCLLGPSIIVLIYGWLFTG